MLFRQTAPGSAQLWEGTGSAPRSISLDFSFISALRWCAEHRALLATAVPRGGRVPEVRSGERGDLRLFRLAESASGFEQVSRGYAHDPVCLRGGRFALRACIVNFRTEAGDVDGTLDVAAELGAALDAEIRPDAMRR